METPVIISSETAKKFKGDSEEKNSNAAGGEDGGACDDPGWRQKTCLSIER